MLRAVSSRSLHKAAPTTLLAGRRLALFPHSSLSSPRHLSTLSSTLRFSDEVKAALEQKKPLVALESTIISHGMPYPANFETAIAVEKVVRDNGATPATIAILDGQIQIGLSQEQIRHLAKMGREAVKASRRDLAVVMAKKQTGATTVSATMLLAHRAGISVFATGGIGGVHRGYEETMDASADLTELGRTPVAVVCAGVKSILDIGRTLEFLETQGVTVATYGKTPDFPAFFTRTSGFQSMLNIETPKEAAELIAANHAIDLQSGIVIGVPIAKEDAMDDILVGEAINIAVKESIEQGIVGKESTPFLLKRVNELTGGNSLKSNIALVKQNASIAAKIAKDLAALNVQPQYRSYSTSARRMKHTQAASGPVMVIGGTVVDITSTATTAMDVLHSSFPGTTRHTLGGVGRNVAEGISLLNGGGNSNDLVFVSVVGEASEGASEDMLGPWLKNAIARRGGDSSEIYPVPGARTATYTAIHDASGNLVSAIADMEIFDLVPIDKVENAIRKYRPRTVCFDANLSSECMKAILETCRGLNVQTFFEPTSVAKCARPLDRTLLEPLKDGLLRFSSPNEYELATMAKQARELMDYNNTLPVRSSISGYSEFVSNDMRRALEDSEYADLLRDATDLSQFIPTLFIKLGAKGVLVFQRSVSGSVAQGGAKGGRDGHPDVTLRWKMFPAHKVESTQSVTGAGDSFVASVVTSIHNADKIVSDPLLSLKDPVVFWKLLDGIVHDGQAAAILTMQTHESISPSLAHSAQAETLRRLKNLLN
ncbi:MAG: Indigoidine synthase A like protein-domain-containing protein [Linnemannia elongata]|nr:MAG: Indigoidine synthase A like protein-domain-containing protein [Linnemannia elongata]